jgi:uncharacterized protein (DUF983 family)
MIATPHRFHARTILRQACPECGEGRIFAGSFGMNARCPACGCDFEPGPGYFTGAMYFSYALGIPIIAAAVLVGKLWLVPSWPLHWILLASWVAFLPLVPAVFRYSRVLFIHFDHFFDPEGEAGGRPRLLAPRPDAVDGPREG